MARRSDIRCSFCGKRQERVRRVIAGPDGVFICNECVALCNQIIDEQERGSGQRPTATRPRRLQKLVAAGRLIQGLLYRRRSWRGAVS